MVNTNFDHSFHNNARHTRPIHLQRVVGNLESGHTMKGGKDVQQSILTRKLWEYFGRFTLLHILLYVVFASIFVMLAPLIPVEHRVGFDVIEPYSLETAYILGQLLRGGVLALILYPFYDVFVRNERGWIVLFGALWGIAVIGSVEPQPGSIEGLIYTLTTATEHALTLTISAIQVLVFSVVLVHWERRNRGVSSYSQGGETDDG